MGRAKIAMKFIENEKTRNKTYQKRKRGLIKKAHELSILCHVPICTIIYLYKDGNQSSQPEVYSFKGGEETQNRHSDNPTCDLDVAGASEPNAAQEIIARYLAFPKDEKKKRELSLFDIFDEQQRRAEQELSKLRQTNAMAKYPTWTSTLSDLSADQLMELLALLDQKLEFVGQKITTIKGVNYCNNQGTHFDYYNTSSFVDQPTPISSLMIPSDDNKYNTHLALNQMEAFNQLVPFNPSNGTIFADQMQTMVADHHHGHGGSSNLVYNMNMMGPMYYDQGQGFADNLAVASSSYSPGTGLPMSMPLHFPMLPNILLPRHYK